MRKEPPSTTAAEDVKDRVEDLAPGVFTRAPRLFWGGRFGSIRFHSASDKSVRYVSLSMQKSLANWPIYRILRQFLRIKFLSRLVMAFSVA
jgi:hypothetical protein